VLFVADRTGERKKMDGSEETESKHRKSWYFVMAAWIQSVIGLSKSLDRCRANGQKNSASKVSKKLATEAGDRVSRGATALTASMCLQIMVLSLKWRLRDLEVEIFKGRNSDMVLSLKQRLHDLEVEIPKAATMTQLL
jgi:hypothetical protein